MSQTSDDLDSNENLLAQLKKPFTSGISTSGGSEELRQHLCAKGILDYRSSKTMIELTKRIERLTYVLIVLTVLLVCIEFPNFVERINHQDRSSLKSNN